MYLFSIKYTHPVFGRICKVLRYVLLLAVVAVMAASCGGSKKSASMRQIEKQSRKNPPPSGTMEDLAAGSKSKKVKQALKEKQKQEKEFKKEAAKAYQDGITRHRSLQTDETRERMNRHFKESEEKYGDKKEFFLARWFRRKDDIEKIERRRAKEVQKRMAATRKTAEKNNKARNMAVTKTIDRKSGRSDPKDDMPHGGGGTYKEGGAVRYSNPADMPQGGGGSYTEGKSKNRAKRYVQPQGGGGNMDKKPKRQK